MLIYDAVNMIWLLNAGSTQQPFPPPQTTNYGCTYIGSSFWCVDRRHWAEVWRVCPAWTVHSVRREVVMQACPVQSWASLDAVSRDWFWFGHFRPPLNWPVVSLLIADVGHQAYHSLYQCHCFRFPVTAHFRCTYCDNCSHPSDEYYRTRGGEKNKISNL